MKNQFGFTLIELLLVIAIAAILVTIAAPSFRDFITRNKIQSEARTLQADISYARSEAVSGNKFITICASSDGSTCNASSDWSGGWIVFEDDGSGGGASDFANIDIANDEKVIRVTQQLKKIDIKAADTDGDGVFGMMFGPRGYVEGLRRSGSDKVSSKATIKVCEPGGSANQARAILMEVTGRSSGSHDANSNGIHEDVAGDDLSC